MTRPDFDDYEAWLDDIAETIYRNGGSSELQNAVHACRPGHPWNRPGNGPLANLKFMLAGRGLIDVNQMAWLARAATIETRKLEGRSA